MHSASADVYELTLSGFCLSGDRHVPGEEHSYNIGVLSDDPGLNRLLQAIKGKRIESMQDRTQLQSYIWVYTEGHELTQADWSGLAALP